MNKGENIVQTEKDRRREEWARKKSWKVHNILNIKPEKVDVRTFIPPLIKL